MNASKRMPCILDLTQINALRRRQTATLSEKTTLTVAELPPRATIRQPAQGSSSPGFLLDSRLVLHKTSCPMKYRDLRDFIAQLQTMGELRRIDAPVSTRLEMTEICDRVLRAGGPALLFTRPQGHSMPVLGNLFGTPRRWRWAWAPKKCRRCATSASCCPI